jgi:hypothetical protein
VVDAVAGLADSRTAQPVTGGTLFFAASTGRGVATSVAHALVERGALSYEQRVACERPADACLNLSGLQDR